MPRIGVGDEPMGYSPLVVAFQDRLRADQLPFLAEMLKAPFRPFITPSRNEKWGVFLTDEVWQQYSELRCRFDPNLFAQSSQAEAKVQVFRDSRNIRVEQRVLMQQ